MSIKRYLTHKVDIVNVTLTRGIRSTVTMPDVAAFITQVGGKISDDSGDHFYMKTVIFLEGDVDVSIGDELIIDSHQRPVVDILYARTTASGIHHLEVEVT